ncbi:MAG: hypothetical protein ACR2NN_10860 [Bryobacteraceae bacterium]
MNSAVVNAATFNNSVAPGTLFSVFGTSFDTSEIAAGNTPLPSALSGFSVTINNHAAPLIYTNSTQINAQMPFEILPGAATLVVSNAVTGLSSIPASISVSASAPGIFTDGQKTIRLRRTKITA